MRSQAGSVAAAAQLAGIDERLVQAAVDYSDDPETPVPAPAEGDGKGVLQLVTPALAAFAGITTVVYVAGSLVLGVRLAFANLPWEPVISQLPREFVVSTGASQVLLPALAVAAIYATYRLLRADNARTPSSSRWKGSSKPARASIGLRTMAVALLLLAPAFGSVVYHDLDVLERWRSASAEDLVPPIAAYLIVFVITAFFRELRAFVASRYRERWNRGITSTAAMCGIYGGALVPGLVAFCATLPLSDAKVCVTDGFEERGSLVGQTSDRVYLGEQTDPPRRLAAIPLSQVEEVFIGHRAREASCDLRGVRAATATHEQAGRAAKSAEAAHRAPRTLARWNDKMLADEAAQVSENVRKAGLASFAAGMAARRSLPSQAAATRRAGDHTIAAGRRLGRTGEALEATPVARRRRRRGQVRREILDAARSAERAARLAGLLADKMIQLERIAAAAS